MYNKCEKQNANYANWANNAKIVRKENFTTEITESTEVFMLFCELYSGTFFAQEPKNYHEAHRDQRGAVQNFLPRIPLICTNLLKKLAKTRAIRGWSFGFA